MLETVSVDIHQLTPTRKHEVHAAVNITLDSTRGAAKLRGKVDTGAQGNILPLRGVLEPSPAILKAYGGATIEHLGTTSITCEMKGKTTNGIFYVTNGNGPALFGWPLLQALDLVNVDVDANNVNAPIIDKESLIQEYPDCFNGIGKLPGKYHITLDPTVPSVVHSLRRVPLALKDDIAAKLQEMEQQGTIIKVTEGQPTDWVNSLVCQRKTTTNWIQVRACACRCASSGCMCIMHAKIIMIIWACTTARACMRNNIICAQLQQVARWFSGSRSHALHLNNQEKLKGSGNTVPKFAACITQKSSGFNSDTTQQYQADKADFILLSSRTTKKMNIIITITLTSDPRTKVRFGAGRPELRHASVHGCDTLTSTNASDFSMTGATAIAQSPLHISKWQYIDCVGLLTPHDLWLPSALPCSCHVIGHAPAYSGEFSMLVSDLIITWKWQYCTVGMFVWDFVELLHKPLQLHVSEYWSVFS